MNQVLAELQKGGLANKGKLRHVHSATPFEAAKAKAQAKKPVVKVSQTTASPLLQAALRTYTV